MGVAWEWGSVPLPRLPAPPSLPSDVMQPYTMHLFGPDWGPTPFGGVRLDGAADGRFAGVGERAVASTTCSTQPPIRCNACQSWTLNHAHRQKRESKLPCREAGSPNHHDDSELGPIGDTTPCKDTPVILHGDVSPEYPQRVAGGSAQCCVDHLYAWGSGCIGWLGSQGLHV